MSMSYSAITVIGVMLPRSVCEVTVQERGCQHEATDGAKYCPTCGKPTLIEKTKSLLEDHFGEFRGIFQDCETDYEFAGLPAFPRDDDEDVLVGFGFESDDCNISFRQIQDTAELYRQIHAALEKVGVWPKEPQYGIWCILHCS